MDRYSVIVLAGLAAVGIGAGVLKGFKVKNLEIHIEPNRSGGIIVMLLGFVAFMVGIAGALGLVGQPTDTKGTGQQSAGASAPRGDQTPSLAPAATAPSGTPTKSAAASVILKQPVANTRVSLKGMIVSGLVRGDLGDSTLWLFTWSDGVWYLDQPMPVAPDQSFQTQSGQLGVPQDVGKSFTLAVLRTDSRQSSTIAKTRKNDEGDVVFSKPPGTVMATRVVTRD